MPFHGEKASRPAFKEERKSKKRQTSGAANEPLEAQMLRDVQVVPKLEKGSFDKKQKHAKGFLGYNQTVHQDTNVEEEKEEELLEGKVAKRVFSQAVLQQQEIADNEKKQTSAKEPFYDVSEDEGREEIEFSEEEEFGDDETAFVDDPSLQIDEQDRKLFEKWVNPVEGISLADLILSKLEKIKEKECAEAKEKNAEPRGKEKIPEKVVLVYEKLGLLLSRYKAGKLPKAFKILPVLKNWSSVLAITRPHKWTPNAVYQAARLFSSTLKPVLAQRFYSSVLLPHVRLSISEHNKLNSHLYMALKKAVYKPSAFFKGVILPLCQDGDCTLKEAVIVSSVVAKVSLPVLHSSACLLKIAELPHTGANSVFIRTLLDKKYTLPHRVLSGVLGHFYSVKDDDRPCYLLWHQCLLVFVQRYKCHFSDEQKQLLLELCQVKHHHLVTPEILREINSTGDEVSSSC